MTKRSETTRDALIQAAAAAFAERGYPETRLEDVVARLEVSKGALYFHFPTKEALAAAVIDTHYAPWPELLTRLRPQYPDSLRLLLELSRQIVDSYQREAGMRAGMRLMSEHTVGGPALPRPLDCWLTTCTRLLSEAREQGNLLPGVDTGRTARLILAAFTGLSLAHIPGADRSDDDLAGEMTGLWLTLLPGLVPADRLAGLNAELTPARPS
ncbi:ScbR family autoregulator-binding transcription factor [Streptomyces sp. NPDC020965]|uniref:ScbR family autoregulator-binding transcription factor n=1 Tax=Streptomyces sp. NPDC020965 TaxID=3365105 RepID=UPI00378B5947